MYLRKRYHFPLSIEAEENHSGKYGAPGQARQKRKKPTPEQIAKQNQWNKEKNTRRLIKKNFGANDYWITLTYQKDLRAKGMEEAKLDIQEFLKKLRKEYKKAGQPLKWILATEQGKRGGIHHHLIINRIPEGDVCITKNWKKGGVHITLLYERGEYKVLADYIAKNPGEQQEKRYSRSRNLIIPKPVIREMKRPTWTQDPKPPKGYYLDKNSLIEGINPVTGFRYRHYTFVKLEDTKNRKKPKAEPVPRSKNANKQKKCPQKSKKDSEEPQK